MINKDLIHAKDVLMIGANKNNKFYRTDGYQHLLLIAPTGTVKGVSFTTQELINNKFNIVIDTIFNEKSNATQLAKKHLAFLKTMKFCLLV